MAIFRFKALEKLFIREPIKVDFPSEKVSDYFGTNVFNLETMQRYLSNNVFGNVKKATKSGKRIDRKIADHVANGMKEWAISRGATHYTHWFHPLTDSTAEKHDAFFELDRNGKSFESFHGELLAQQEPDASSFPNGSIRNTFEARGYTAWDPSSPAFVIDKTLFIPTIFISYTGETLDYKAPLLKSLNILDKAAVKVCHYFDKNVKKVIATLGWEQEYFLVDEALYLARPDLVLTKRTLMGHTSAKGQQLDDHYFSSIPERVIAYMKDFEIEAHKLGIPVKTRHNEVAPNQFECAPIFEEVNLANDHNQLLMDIMRKTAQKHKFKVLFHEKPFKGINGSGKHNNWSMATDTYVNLLKPGRTPKKNLQFLIFLINTIKAVNDYGDLLRASIMSAGNQHRLGSNEAPPSIISVFLGKELNKMLNKLEKSVSNKKMTADEKKSLQLDIGKIPEILLDNTDRNRTSPFAFTGNRFEFRAVGSTGNCGGPITILNTAVADRLNLFTDEVDKLIDDNIKKEDAIFQVLRNYIIDSKNIRFEGNGYSQKWIKEATKRGLSNITSPPESFKEYISEKTAKLFEKYNILSKRELNLRYEVKIEEFTKKIQLESRVLGDLAMNHIIPTAVNYQKMLVDSIKAIKEVFDVDEYIKLTARRKEVVKNIAHHTTSISKKVQLMIKERKKSNRIEDIRDKVDAYYENVIPFFDEIRYNIDKLELIVDNELWPLPKYRELLFNR